MTPDLTGLAVGCIEAEHAGAGGWPAGDGVDRWLRAQLPDRAPPGTVARAVDGRFDVVAVEPPALLLVGPAAGWWLVPVAPAGDSALTDGDVRRWRGGAGPGGVPVDLPDDVADRLDVVTAVLRAAALVGVAHRALDLAVAHGRSREQFGRPVAAFQSVAHRLADMYCAVELARSSVLLAAVTGEPGAARLAALLAASSLPDVVTGAVHVHGAVGLTAEVPVHLALRRALVLRALLGGPAAAVDAVRADLQHLADRTQQGVLR